MRQTSLDEEEGFDDIIAELDREEERAKIRLTMRKGQKDEKQQEVGGAGIF